MRKRIVLLALSCFSLLFAVPARALHAQTVGRLSDKDTPVLVSELRVRLNVPDTSKAAAPAPARVSDADFNALIAAAAQAYADLMDQTSLNEQEACAAQWGSRDEAGVNLRKETQNRRHNLEWLTNNAGDMLPLLEKYVQTKK
ncbi:MAG TPA: hypothetical protein VHB25_06790 [Gemmatimonadaceae bacterium]|nr:hypothetical protein [Gemmatimonadaceae bacterium]